MNKVKITKFSEWKRSAWNNKYLMLISLILLATAIILDYLAGAYVTTVPAVEAPDLILDNIPTLDLDFIFLYGIILIIVVLLVYPLLFKIREFHRVISQFSLLIAVRAAFTTFTHLKIPAQALVFTLPRIFSFITFQNDLFFSGHTAVPFLGFLLFRHSKIKYFFLVSSIIMAAVVLFMHVHYTIDVFSAFFITYGTFKIGECFFKKISKGS